MLFFLLNLSRIFEFNLIEICSFRGFEFKFCWVLFFYGILNLFLLKFVLLWGLEFKFCWGFVFLWGFELKFCLKIQFIQMLKNQVYLKIK